MRHALQDISKRSARSLPTIAILLLITSDITRTYRLRSAKVSYHLSCRVINWLPTSYPRRGSSHYRSHSVCIVRQLYRFSSPSGIPLTGVAGGRSSSSKLIKTLDPKWIRHLISETDQKQVRSLSLSLDLSINNFPNLETSFEDQGNYPKSRS